MTNPKSKRWLNRILTGLVVALALMISLQKAWNPATISTAEALTDSSSEREVADIHREILKILEGLPKTNNSRAQLYFIAAIGDCPLYLSRVQDWKELAVRTSKEELTPVVIIDGIFEEEAAALRRQLGRRFVVLIDQMGVRRKINEIGLLSPLQVLVKDGEIRMLSEPLGIGTGVSSMGSIVKLVTGLAS